MKCPYCDTEMLLGCLHVSNAIWSEKENKMLLAPCKNEKYALYLKLPFSNPNRVESYCCPGCKKIIIDAAGYPHNLD